MMDEALLYSRYRLLQDYVDRLAGLVDYQESKIRHLERVLKRHCKVVDGLVGAE